MTPKSSKDSLIEKPVSNKCRVKLTVSPETKEKLMNDCVKEFLIHHPELKGMNITEEFIEIQIIEHYLRAP